MAKGWLCCEWLDQVTQKVVEKPYFFTSQNSTALSLLFIVRKLRRKENSVERQRTNYSKGKFYYREEKVG
jgi:hypothetical protein